MVARRAGRANVVGVASGNAESMTFPANVYKVQTLSDGGIRVTLDMPETEIMASAWLAQCQVNGIVLSLCCTHWSRGKHNEGCQSAMCAAWLSWYSDTG